MSVGFIGAGRMAQALAKGFIAGGVRKTSDVIASAPKDDIHSINEFKKLGCDVTHENRDVLKNADVVILAVKPNVVPKVLNEIKIDVSVKNLLVSVALGVPIAAMEDILPMGVRTVRVMSNTPSIVGQGATVYSLGSYANEGDSKTIKELFSSVSGVCEQVPESNVDAVTGLSGSGPAYCFLAIEALADGGVKQGLPRDLALKLAAQTLLGSAKMVLETGKHPGSLKDDVCSPAGCTIQALSHLERSGFRSSLIEAVDAATQTARETAEAQFAAKEVNNNGYTQVKNASLHSNGKRLVVNNMLQ